MTITEEVFMSSGAVLCLEGHRYLFGFVMTTPPPRSARKRRRAGSNETDMLENGSDKVRIVA
jgi:hypothetical protein